MTFEFFPRDLHFCSAGGRGGGGVGISIENANRLNGPLLRVPEGIQTVHRGSALLLAALRPFLENKVGFFFLHFLMPIKSIRGD